MDNLTNKNILQNKLNEYIKSIFPDNKIPLYYSPIGRSDNRYITWNQYNETSIHGEFEDNYCRPNELGNYQAPSNSELINCEQLNSNNDIINLIDLNKFINNQLNVIKDKAEFSDENNNYIKKIDDMINDYKMHKNNLYNQKKTLDNLKNVSELLFELNNEINKSTDETKNKININNDEITGYQNIANISDIKNIDKFTNFNSTTYIYIIIALVTIVVILQITYFAV